jgi:hypothetical protein
VAHRNPRHPPSSARSTAIDGVGCRMLRKAAKQIQFLHLSAHPNKNTWNPSVCNDCEKAGQLERTLLPAMTAIPSDADEVGGKVGQPASDGNVQRRGQRESGAARAGATPSDDGNPQRRGQSARESGAARAGAMPSDDGNPQRREGGRHKRSLSPAPRSRSESLPGSRRRWRGPVTQDPSFETPASKQVNFKSPEGVDPKAPNELLMEAAARNEHGSAQVNLGDTNTLGKHCCSSDPNCFLRCLRAACLVHERNCCDCSFSISSPDQVIRQIRRLDGGGSTQCCPSSRG